MKKNKRYTLIALLLITLFLLTIPNFSATAQTTQGWTMTVNAQSLKAYPNLTEYVWVKSATMQPNGPYDQIALHRLVLAGRAPNGVVLVVGCPTWGTGTEMISNPETDSWTKTEDHSQAIYWANRGFDVYAIDFRTHFAPNPLNTTQASFEANWGWDQWISDIKEAANLAKAISGNDKFFIAGYCTGGEAALNYATKYWQTDLRGIIIEDMNFIGVPAYPVVSVPVGTNSYNLTQAIYNMTATNSWIVASIVSLYSFRLLANYALQNPSAPAQYPPGTTLQPAINPQTNSTWTNITQYITYLIQNNFGSTSYPPGYYSNLNAGYGDISQVEYCFANQEPLPGRLIMENLAMADWTNCPYMSYDYNDHYSQIGVPILAFEAANFANYTGQFRFVNGTATNDFTGIMLKNYGHLDLFYGTYSARDVSEPALEWMVNHQMSPIFTSGFENGFNSWTSTYGGVSVVTSPVYQGNYSMKCSDPWGSLAAKKIGQQTETYTSAEFRFDQNVAGDQTLIAYRNWAGNPTASMGISVQSGRIYLFVQTILPSYSYNQYELTGFTPGTWYKFALDASATSAAVYLNDKQVASVTQANIPATDAVNVGMFWGTGTYNGNLYVDNVQISIPQP